MRNKNNNKNINNNQIKVIIVGVIAIIIIAVIISIVLAKNNADSISNSVENERKNINMDAEPAIYYSPNGVGQISLQEDDMVFAYVTITWIDDCTGVIKKNGKEFSNKSGTSISEEGEFEITVTSPKKGSVTKKITIDRTPPAFEVKKNSNGKVTISFEDINDIESAILYKFNDAEEHFEQLSDLKADGLKESIEIKEKGFYSIKCMDKVENIKEEEFEIDK